ncbi:hypothetical protein ROS1_60130 [Roseibium sp. ROS1]
MVSSITIQTPVNLAQQHAAASAKVTELTTDQQAPEGQVERAIDQSGNIKELQQPDTQRRALSEAKFYAQLKLSAAQSRQISAELRDGLREEVAFLEKTDPVPARVLEGNEAVDARRLISTLQANIVTEDGLKGYIVDDLRYDLRPDGTITVNEAAVPTSEAQKQERLSGFKETLTRLESLTGGLSQEQLQQNVASAQLALERAQSAQTIDIQV